MDGLDAVTVIARVVTVIVCAELDTTRYEESVAFVAVTAHVVPALPVTDNVVPEIEQPAVPAVVTAYVTAPPPDPPEVDNVSVPPKVTVDADDIDSVACDAWLMVKVPAAYVIA